MKIPRREIWVLTETLAEKEKSRSSVVFSESCDCNPPGKDAPSGT